MKIDDLRIIEHTNTQVRCLPIITQMLRVINSRSMPIPILKTLMYKWSEEQMSKSEFYKNHNGILSKNENNKIKNTTALLYYLELCENIGLVTRINEVVKCSKFGLLFLILDKDFKDQSNFSTFEKVFYLYFLLFKDADNIILIMNRIKDIPMNQVQIRNIYEVDLKKRLLSKLKISDFHTQNQIQDKYRKVEFEWKNAKEYAKHIIPPRLEWLVDIGLCTINDSRKYVLSETGKKLNDFFYTIPETSFNDINEEWLNNRFILITSEIFLQKKKNHYEKGLFPNELISNAFNVLDNDGIRRVSAHPFFIYIMIQGFFKYKIPITWNNIVELVKKPFEHYKFDIRKAGRINESYFTMSLNLNDEEK